MNAIHLGMRQLWWSSVRVPVTPTVKILDVGCGSGIWAKELAEALPTAQVMGVDLSPTVLPGRHPENLSFEVPSSVFQHISSQTNAETGRRYQRGSSI